MKTAPLIRTVPQTNSISSHSRRYEHPSVGTVISRSTSADLSLENATMQEWVADANQAVSLRLGELSLRRYPATSNVLTTVCSIVRDPKDENYKDIVGVNGDRQLLEPFHPAFTYPIFGDKEVIFGYKGLKVRVSTGCS